MATRGEHARRWGARCERLTLWLLWLRGWSLAGWRVKVGRAELDLLVTRGDEVRLVEVKARKPGTWTSADLSLSYPQRLRLQRAFQTWLDRHPWPGRITFQRVSWAGWRWRMHPPERWDSLKLPRGAEGQALP